MSDNTPMTAKQIRAMEPDRKMDVFMAELIGWKVISEHEDVKRRQTSDYGAGAGIIAMYGNWYIARAEGKSFRWAPSVDVSAAFFILERPEIMDRYQIGVYPTSFGKWFARPFMPGYDNCEVMADTAPEAICKCILLAKELHP